MEARGLLGRRSARESSASRHRKRAVKKWLFRLRNVTRKQMLLALAGCFCICGIIQLVSSHYRTASGDFSTLKKSNFRGAVDRLAASPTVLAKRIFGKEGLFKSYDDRVNEIDGIMEDVSPTEGVPAYKEGHGVTPVGSYGEATHYHLAGRSETTTKKKGGDLVPADKNDHAAQVEHQQNVQRAASIQEQIKKQREPEPAAETENMKLDIHQPVGMVEPEHVIVHKVTEAQVPPNPDIIPPIAPTPREQIRMELPVVELSAPEIVIKPYHRQLQFNVPKLLPRLSPDEDFALTWTYDAAEKLVPYVTHEVYLRQLYPNETLPLQRSDEDLAKFPKEDQMKGMTRLAWTYYNSLAVFPGYNTKDRMHGMVGVYPNGTELYETRPLPPAADEIPGGKNAALKNGGFYMALSDALPLDRQVADSRSPICASQTYDLQALQDASVIITFYNEPISTLMRSVHSILNFTPPPLLREIILVDDHSNLTDVAPGGVIYEHIKLLPKVKLMRLPERRGIVTARLIGAKVATAPVIVVLDSHIECQPVWMEPLLKRLQESPRSLVFPIIPGVDGSTLTYLPFMGIGTHLSFKWKIQERPFAVTVVDKPDAVPSASLAGGLFAIRRDWFWELGGYDSNMQMWGAENVEMGFRTWMCGGRVECAPCSNVYHIFRQGGVGYNSPSKSIYINRLRTAQLWLGEYYQFAKYFITTDEKRLQMDLGSFDNILAMKERLQCKDFKWFLQNVDPNKVPQTLEDVDTLGHIKQPKSGLCFDTMQRDVDEYVDLYPCHGGGGPQMYLTLKHGKHIFLGQDETRCLGKDFKILDCYEPDTVKTFWFIENSSLMWQEPGASDKLCVTLKEVRLLRTERYLGHSSLFYIDKQDSLAAITAVLNCCRTELWLWKSVMDGKHKFGKHRNLYPIQTFKDRNSQKDTALI